MPLNKQIFSNVWDDVILNVKSDVANDTITAIGADKFNLISPILVVPVYASVQSIKTFVNTKLRFYEFTRYI